MKTKLLFQIAALVIFQFSFAGVGHAGSTVFPQKESIAKELKSIFRSPTNQPAIHSGCYQVKKYSRNHHRAHRSCYRFK